MTTALLSLGSNMGNPREYLSDALDVIHPVATSDVYRTPPWGPVEQNDFLNLAAIVSHAAADALHWWHLAQQAEQAANRQRTLRWGPRTLDVDVIAVWNTAADGKATTPILSDDPDLTLPHPRAHLRGFVLVPWAQLQPDAVLPGHGPISTLIATLRASGELDGIERVGRLARP